MVSLSYIANHLMTNPLRDQLIVFPRLNVKILGKQIKLFPLFGMIERLKVFYGCGISNGPESGRLKVD